MNSQAADFIISDYIVFIYKSEEVKKKNSIIKVTPKQKKVSSSDCFTHLLNTLTFFDTSWNGLGWIYLMNQALGTNAHDTKTFNFTFYSLLDSKNSF